MEQFTQSTPGIDELLSRYEIAVKRKDVESIVSLHASDIEAFDLMMPFKYAGITNLKDRVEQWFDSYDSDIDFSFNDVRINQGEDMAVCHALVRTKGILGSGEPSEMWTRSTLALKLQDQEWKIFHEHTSDPIDMKTGKAVTELTPLKQ